MESLSDLRKILYWLPSDIVSTINDFICVNCNKYDWPPYTFPDSSYAPGSTVDTGFCSLCHEGYCSNCGRGCAPECLCNRHSTTLRDAACIIQKAVKRYLFCENGTLTCEMRETPFGPYCCDNRVPKRLAKKYEMYHRVFGGNGYKCKFHLCKECDLMDFDDDGYCNDQCHLCGRCYCSICYYGCQCED